MVTAAINVSTATRPPSHRPRCRPPTKKPMTTWCGTAGGHHFTRTGPRGSNRPFGVARPSRTATITVWDGLAHGVPPRSTTRAASATPVQVRGDGGRRHQVPRGRGACARHSFLRSSAVTGLRRSKCGAAGLQAGDRDPEGRAGDVVQPHSVEEVHRLRIPSVLAAHRSSGRGAPRGLPRPRSRRVGPRLRGRSSRTERP